MAILEGDAWWVEREYITSLLQPWSFVLEVIYISFVTP